MRLIAASADIRHELDPLVTIIGACARIRQTLACIATICFHIELHFSAMNECQRAKFIRGLAQECRMHAAMTKFPEGRQRWLNSAQEYERQADQLEAIDAKNTIGPASILPFRRLGSR